MNRERVVGILALVLAAFIGGAVTPPIVKVGVSQMSPFTFNFLRMILTSLLFSPLFWRYRHEFLKKNLYPFLALISVTSGANFMLFALGISRTTVVASQLLYALLPISVPVIAYFLIKERITRYKVIGAALGLMGVSILVLFSRSAEQQVSLGTLPGNLLILAAVLFYTVYLVMSKKFNLNYSPYFIAGLTYLGSAFFLLPLSLYELSSRPQLVLTNSSMIALVGIAISSSLFLCCLQFGLRRVSATTMSITALLAPVFGALGGAVVFNEKVSGLLGVSMILILAGVVASVFGEKKGWRDYCCGVRDRVLGFVWQKL